jgi:ADP-heptose:LPS heptosyltransferase
MPNPPKHILVIRLSAMGDVAMTVPVVRAFTGHYPDVKLTILTRKFFAPFFRDIPNTVVFDADVSVKHKGLLGLYQLSRDLKKQKIDAVADLHNVLRSNILKLFLAGLPFAQINKGRAEKKALISGTEFKQLKSTHQRYADVFEKLGFSLSLANPKFLEKRPLSENIEAVIGQKTKKWIGIAPFAQYESKMYPLNLMEKVIEKLSVKNKVLLFGGGKSEVLKLEEIQSKYDNVVNIAGKFSLDEELDIISSLDIMLSMDSGNAHIAAMLGKKVVTLWGVTHPYAGFYPFNQNSGSAILADKKQYPKIPTSVYGNKFPENYRDSMQSISPEGVIDKIKSLL